MTRKMQCFGLALVASLAACGDDGGDGNSSPDAATNSNFDAGAAIDAAVQQRNVQVTVTGLRGAIALALNGGSPQSLSADGTLTLGALDVGASYAVTIDSQPGIQGCELSDDTGTIAEADVDVAISCEVLIFTTMQDGVNGMEWWKTDGTDAGTIMLRNIAAGAAGSAFEPDYAVLPRDYVIFAANDLTNGQQLWRSDGTMAGTTLLKIINPTGSAGPQNFVAFGDAIFFNATNGVDGNELWKTDGTEVGTVMVKNIDDAASNSLNLQNATVLGDSLYFGANDGVNGIELWKTDGTEVGTVMVKDIDDAGNSDPRNFAVMNNTLYFSADGGALTGREVWKSDGTEGGTVMLKDINPDAADANPGNLTAVGNVLYINASSPGTNGGLWKSDGTEVGTTEVLSLGDGGPANWGEAVVFEGNLYFRAASMADGFELWRSDGTPGGTAMLKDIKGPGGSPNEADPRDMSLVSGGFVFSVFNDGSGRELWKSDGTEVGTTLLADINDGMGGSNVFQWGDKAVYFRDFALYFADNGTSDMEPYRVDFSGATQIKEVNPNGAALPEG